MEEEAPLCACGITASTGISKKEGAHLGKAFFGCGKFGTDQRLCRFFQWKKEIRETSQGPKRVMYLSDMMRAGDTVQVQKKLQPEVVEEMEQREEKREKSEKDLLEGIYREVKKMRKMMEEMGK